MTPPLVLLVTTSTFKENILILPSTFRLDCTNKDLQSNKHFQGEYPAYPQALLVLLTNKHFNGDYPAHTKHL